MTAAQSTLRILRERLAVPALAVVASVGVLFGEPLYLPGGRAIRLGLTLVGVAAAAAAALLARTAGRNARIERERHRTIVEATVEGIWLVDAEGRTQYVNPQMAALLGYAADEMPGRPLEDFVPGERDRAVFRRAMTDPGASSDLHELSLRTKTGRDLDALITIGPAGGEGAVAVVADNTARKRDYDANAVGAAVVRTTPDAIITVGVDGAIRSWNPAAEQLFGYSRDDMVGAPIRTIMAPDRPHEAAEKIEELRRGEAVAPYETVRRHRDGTLVEVAVTLSPFRDAAGRLTGTAAIIRDITRRRRLEEQLRNAQKMEAIGVLAGGVAHDFNNSLMAIRGYSELMLGRLAADDPLRGDAEAIQKAAEGAATVTRQLLAFSRRQVLEPRLLDVNEIVADLEPMLVRLVGGSVVVRSVPGEALGRVRADRSQIEQVLVNLAVNARDAMPTGGELTIETAEVELADDDGLGESRRYVLLAVSDTGVGMTTEVRERAFEPFFTTKADGTTAGLGLATVYGIVEQSGGRVWAYSEPGLGTAFKIYLPVAAEAPGPGRTGADAPGDALTGRECVLLLEDEDTVRNVVRQMLASKGYTVLEARDGHEALAVAEAHDGGIDLVVTDVVMPGMSGPEFVQRLRVLRPDVRVLFISGYTDDAVVHHGVLEEGVVFLQKPFAGAALARKAREALDGPAPVLPLVVR